MVCFDAVVAQSDNTYAYYPMQLDPRLIKSVQYGCHLDGGSVIELVTGQKIHADQIKSEIDAQIDRLS